MSLDFGKIKKREIATENYNEIPANKTISHESVVKLRITSLNERLQQELSKDHNEITPQLERNWREFISSISDSKNSDRFVDEAIIFVSEFNKIDEGFADSITGNIISTIIPCLEINSLNRVESRIESNEYGRLTEDQSNKILESVKDYQVATRILENHYKISKRFNIENEIAQIRSRGLSRTIESVCDIVNTYKIEPYQKLNICIEEMTYLLDKNGISYDKSQLVRESLENIILSNELDLHNLHGYSKALTKSYVLEQDDLNSVERIISDDYNFGNRDNISNYIDAFLINPEKDYASLASLCVKCGKECTPIDLSNNIGKLVSFVRKCSIFDITNNEGISSCIDSLSDAICDRSDIGKDNIDIIITKIKDTTNGKDFVAPYNITSDQEKNDTTSNLFENMIVSLENTKNMYYDKSNLESIEYFSREPEQISVNEFKIFKFNNLIKAAFNLNKYLKIKSNRLMRKPKQKVARFISRARNILFGESVEEWKEAFKDHLGQCVSEDNIPDICVTLYEYTEDEAQDVQEFLAEICGSYNDTLAINGDSNIKSYYIMNPGVAEVHIRENIQLVETDTEKIDKDLSFEDVYYINLFKDTEEMLDEAAINHYENITEYFKEFSDKNLSIDHVKVALEAMSIIGVSKQEVNLFQEYCHEINDINFVEDFSYEDCSENFTESEKLEAYNTLAAILEAPELHKPKVGPSAASYWDDDDDDDEDDEDESGNYSTQKDDESDKKEDKSDNSTPLDSNNDGKISKSESKKKFGVDLNGLKLALLGMKKRFGDMGQKEKELSNNLDNASRILVKGMKDALISDRREAVIKGSIIPSFSKCIKIAVGLAGVAKFIDPGLAIIAAVGGFAMSKHLTKKERILLLDDIEVELDVVEKEINLAESRNQINRYRALQKYKKDLQRQYQRIKYNVRIGKDILPGSTVGVKSFED